MNQRAAQRLGPQDILPARLRRGVHRRLWAVTSKVSGAFKQLLIWQAGGVNRPAIYDVSAVSPELQALASHWKEIREELEQLLARRAELPSVEEVEDDYRQWMDRYPVAGDGLWRVFAVCAWGTDLRANQALCPRTHALVRGVPNICQALFSVLEPGKAIHPHHNGGYCGVLKYHLALRVPRRNPPSIRIREHHHTWREGETLLFDDSLEHEVFNSSDEIRVVLMLDVLRPLPWWLHALNWSWQRLYRRTVKRSLYRNMERTQLAAH